jgi:hypothetical protein
MTLWKKMRRTLRWARRNQGERKLQKGKRKNNKR